MLGWKFGEESQGSAQQGPYQQAVDHGAGEVISQV